MKTQNTIKKMRSITPTLLSVLFFCIDGFADTGVQKPVESHPQKEPSNHPFEKGSIFLYRIRIRMVHGVQLETQKA